MALPGEMVDLAWLNERKDAPQRRAIRQVAVMQVELFAVDRGVAAEVFDAGADEIARPANNPVDGISLLDQQLAQIGTVLASDTGDQSDAFCSHSAYCSAHAQLTARLLRISGRSLAAFLGQPLATARTIR